VPVGYLTFSATYEQVFCLLFGDVHTADPTLQSMESVVVLDYGRKSTRKINLHSSVKSLTGNAIKNLFILH